MTEAEVRFRYDTTRSGAEILLMGSYGPLRSTRAMPPGTLATYHRRISALRAEVTESLRTKVAWIVASESGASSTFSP